LPKELINAKKKEIPKETKDPVEINHTQKSNYLSFKSNQIKNTKSTKFVNLTAENKLNSKFGNALKM